MLAVLAVVAPAHRVDVVIHGEDEAMPQWIARLREQVERDGRSLAITRSGAIDLAAALATPRPDDAQLAQIWLELAPDGALEILVVDGPRARALLREVPAPAGLDEAAREAVATIAASAIEAIAAGEPVGRAHDELEAEVAAAGAAAPTTSPASDPTTSPSLPTPPRPRAAAGPTVASTPTATRSRLPTAARVRAALELGWRAQAWQADAPALQHGPIAALAIVAAVPRLSPGAVVSGQFRLPAHVRDAGLDARLLGGAVRALATIEPSVARRVRLRARAGFGVDLLHVAVSGIDRPATARTRTLPIFALGFGTAAYVSARVALAVDASLELDLVDTKLVLLGQHRTIFDPWRPRPGLGFTVQWDVVAPP
ncbi:MAG: hypothetical protein K1X88_31520 [Nannocystaceae bacterium]|nr:hypothetical protein [Nannocystaceae bacterium]